MSHLWVWLDLILPNETQMQRIPAGDGTEAGHARSLTEVNERCPNYSNSGSSSSRQEPVERKESEFLPEICDPVPDAKDGILQELARGVARVQGQPDGTEEGSESSDGKRVAAGAKVRTGNFRTSTPPSSQTDRSFGVSRWTVGKVPSGAVRYETPRSTTILSNCALGVPQVSERACASLWSKTSKSTGAV